MLFSLLQSINDLKMLYLNNMREAKENAGIILLQTKSWF